MRNLERDALHKSFISSINPSPTSVSTENSLNLQNLQTEQKDLHHKYLTRCSISKSFGSLRSIFKRRPDDEQRFADDSAPEREEKKTLNLRIRVRVYVST